MRRFVVLGGSARPIRAGHPWVYASSVRETDPLPGPDDDDDARDVALVVDERGRVLGRGLVSDASALRIRLLETGTPTPRPVLALLAERIEAAAALRRRLFPPGGPTDAFRLVHGEGDRLPGLVVDRYADVLVAQFATAPLYRRREPLATALLRATGARSLVARTGGYEAAEAIDADAPPFGAGDSPPEAVRAIEEGMRIEVDVRHGQKTGHYADQRENRLHVAALARGTRLLDLYAGTGGFSIQALRHGAASALSIETSKRAHAAARRSAESNGVAAGLEAWDADVRHALLDLKRAGRLFDVAVVDPPNFFPRRGGRGHADKAYREINVRAMTRLRPGGVLASFCCSARLSQEAFCAIVLAAARECRRPVRVLRELTAGPDHPVSAASPEGRYLSGVLALVDAPAAPPGG